MKWKITYRLEGGEKIRYATKEARSQTTAVALVQASHTIPIVIIEIKQLNG